MGRPIRLSAPNTTYHIIIRCNNSDFLINSKSDFLLFLSILHHYKQKFNFKLYGYCILNSHIHLIIQTPDDPEISISKIMHAICWRYAITYNKRHNRKGHFFNDRFKSPIVQDDVYGVELMKYISQNPVRAGLVKNAKDWRWSSYRVYAYGEYDPLIDIMPSYEGMSARRSIAARMFREKVEGIVGGREEMWSKRLVIGDRGYVIGVYEKFGINYSDKFG